MPVIWDDTGYPFAFWAGDFYMFSPEPADAGATMQTDVVRLHPGATTRETVARIEGVVAERRSPEAHGARHRRREAFVLDAFLRGARA